MKLIKIVTTTVLSLQIPGILLSFALFGQCLLADILIYEGFSYKENVAGARHGWSDGWGAFEGSPTLKPDDLEIRGLDSTAGFMQLVNDSVCVSQIETNAVGVVYGSFRVRMSSYVNDSTVGLLVFDPNASDVRLDDARLALIIKGWRIPFSSVVVSGKKTRASTGAEIDFNQTYLVLFKLVNPRAEEGSLTMWICAPEQIEHLISNGISEDYLMRAEIGSDVDQVARCVTASIPANDEPIFKDGSVICLMSRFGAYATYDEIRISNRDLAEAAGLQGAASEAKSHARIPYISN